MYNKRLTRKKTYLLVTLITVLLMPRRTRLGMGYINPIVIFWNGSWTSDKTVIFGDSIYRVIRRCHDIHISSLCWIGEGLQDTSEVLTRTPRGSYLGCVMGNRP